MLGLTSALVTVGLLVISNTFMTFAWYGHLKLQNAGISTHWPLAVVILFSWGIALLEYCFMVPANRIGFSENGGPFSLMQLKIIQEVVTLTVFTIFVYDRDVVEENPFDVLDGPTYLGESDRFYYGIYFPTDVNYPPEEPKAAEHYEELSEFARDRAAESFSILP